MGHPCSYPQIAMREVFVGGELFRRALPNHPALFDDVMPVDERGHFLEVLVDHEDRLAEFLLLTQGRPDVGADQRGEPFRRLIEDQERRVGQKRPADGRRSRRTS